MTYTERASGSAYRFYSAATLAELGDVFASQQARLVRRSREIATSWYDFQDLRFKRNRLWNALGAACRDAHMSLLRHAPADQAVYAFRPTAAGGLQLVQHAQMAGGSGLHDRSETLMRCTQQRVDGTVRLSVSGELDLATAPTFRAHLEMAMHGTDNVVVDLSGLLYLDSTGINALLDAHRTLERSRRQIILIAPSPTVQRILSVLSIERLMPVVPTIEAAVRFLSDGNGSERGL